MLVKDLIEDLKKMDPEAAVGFQGNGTWSITGMTYGKMPKQSRGYVLLHSNGKSNPESHDPPREQ